METQTETLPVAKPILIVGTADMSSRYRKDLSPEQVAMLTTLFLADLMRYGYDVSEADTDERGVPTRPERSYQLTARRSG